MLELSTLVPGLLQPPKQWNSFSLDHGCDLPGTVFGLTCDSATGRVTRIDVPYPLMASVPLPASIGGLASLEWFRMSGAAWNGTLPSSFSSLSKLELFVTPNARFSGPLPTLPTNLAVFDAGFDGVDHGWNANTFPSAPALNELRLHNYNFGLNTPIPSTIFSLPQLSLLQLDGVTFDGSVPENGLLTHSSLTALYLAGSPAMSDLPPSSNALSSDVSGLSNLFTLSLDNLPWSGTLPTIFAPSLGDIFISRLPYINGTIASSMLDGRYVVNLKHLPLVTGDLPAPEDINSSALSEVTVLDVGLTGYFNASLLEVYSLRFFVLSNVPAMAPQPLLWPTFGACTYLRTFDVYGFFFFMCFLLVFVAFLVLAIELYGLSCVYFYLLVLTPFFALLSSGGTLHSLALFLRS